MGESSSAAPGNKGRLALWTPRGSSNQPGPEYLLSNTILKNREITQKKKKKNCEITHIKEICFLYTILMHGEIKA